MITYIKINGFKSFHNFEMEFTPFTMVAGANASGKSNLFDALQLLSRLAETDNLKKAFKEQRGEFIELFTQYSGGTYAKDMSFCVEMLVDKAVKDAWGNETTLKYTRLRYEIKIKRIINASGIQDLVVTHEHLENLKHSGDEWIRRIPKAVLSVWRPRFSKGGRRATPYIMTSLENQIPTVLVPQDGIRGGNKRRFPLKNATRTVLSSFDTIDFPHVFAAKQEMMSWKFLQLNPEDLRQPTKKDIGLDKVTASGKNLAAVLFRIKQLDEYALVEISRKFQTFLPNFVKVDVLDDKENNQFIIQLTDKDQKKYSSRVLSEGTLRILTLCILEYDEQHTGLLCFEEPENGIHPFKIKDMASLLRDLSIDFSDTEAHLRQVIINTHSPVLIGCVYDWMKDATTSVWYAHLTNRVTEIDGERTNFSVSSIIPVEKEGVTQFSIEFPTQAKKLTISTVQKMLQACS
ncbi:MAG: AAA family ATPase [Bacteroidota bacterium]